MTTVAEIAAEAFSGVSVEITDAVHAASLKYETQGAYNTTTGAYEVVQTVLTGRAVVDSVTPMADIFPDYVAGPADELVLLEGFTVLPQEGWRLEYSTKKRTVKQVRDIVAAGSLFYVLAT